MSTENEHIERINFIEFVSSPSFPYLSKNLFGWKLAHKLAGDSSAAILDEAILDLSVLV